MKPENRQIPEKEREACKVLCAAALDGKATGNEYRLSDIWGGTWVVQVHNEKRGRRRLASASSRDRATARRGR